MASATVAMNMTTTMMILHTILRVMFPLKQPSENFQNVSRHNGSSGPVKSNFRWPKEIKKNTSFSKLKQAHKPKCPLQTGRMHNSVARRSNQVAKGQQSSANGMSGIGKTTA